MILSARYRSSESFGVAAKDAIANSILHTASITAAVLIHRIVVLLVIFHPTLRLSRLNAHSPYWRQKLCQTGTALWPAARASVGMVAVLQWLAASNSASRAVTPCEQRSHAEA